MLKTTIVICSAVVISAPWDRAHADGVYADAALGGGVVGGDYGIGSSPQTLRFRLGVGYAFQRVRIEGWGAVEPIVGGECSADASCYIDTGSDALLGYGVDTELVVREWGNAKFYLRGGVGRLHYPNEEAPNWTGTGFTLGAGLQLARRLSPTVTAAAYVEPSFDGYWMTTMHSTEATFASFIRLSAGALVGTEF